MLLQVVDLGIVEDLVIVLGRVDERTLVGGEGGRVT